MSHDYHPVLVVLVVLGLAACGGSDNSDTGADSAAALSDAARFDSEFSKNGCELLTANMVSATFNVPADELRQMKILGCNYDWSNDETTVEAGISMIRAHKSEQSAAQWFGNATKSKTAAEMKAEMEEVAKRLDAKQELDSNAAKPMAKAILAGIGNKAVNFEDVAGVGEEARVNDNGSVYVRVDNLTFIVSAYQGPKAPPPDLKGVEIKQMAKVAKESADQWARETAPQRVQDGTQLARAIAAEL